MRYRVEVLHDAARDRVKLILAKLHFGAKAIALPFSRSRASAARRPYLPVNFDFTSVSTAALSEL